MIFDSIENASKYFILGERIKKGVWFFIKYGFRKFKTE